MSVIGFRKDGRSTLEGVSYTRLEAGTLKTHRRTIPKDSNKEITRLLVINDRRDLTRLN